VPDFYRLRPDADARRTRGARGSRARRLDVSNGFTDVDALFDALHASRDADDEGGLSILEHSLQCGELLRADHPDDVELQVDGLVALRRADDSAKVRGKAVPDLHTWRTAVEAVTARP